MNKPLSHITTAPGPGLHATRDSSVLKRLTEHKALEMTQSLQTTLDPSRLIEIFSMEVGSLIIHQGIRYRNSELDLDVKLGSQVRHSCSYELNLGDEPLGRLTFRRQQKFSTSEIEALEHLLCSLLYPLRNALLYQDAVQLARKDPLTGICNRAALDESLRREISHAQRNGGKIALLIMDIDHFKQVNDKYGHIVGDCVIRAIAKMADACKRDSDLLFRYGGEEFVIVMRDTDLEGGLLLSERVREHIETHPCTCSGARMDITVSIGVSELQEHDSPVSLFARADQALYSAKRNGRNRICGADLTGQ
ncbi:MAG: GGDEF domain-containing protein [Thiogranum sp.]|nr:GGDEF domain-containing protein [Thiogranum sp.]